MMMYLVKPIVMMGIGSLLLIVGIILTVFHFLYEGDPFSDDKNPPYFTFGPVVFALGIFQKIIVSKILDSLTNKIIYYY